MSTIPGPIIISRDTAAANGLVRYFSGEPCAYGHVAERRVVGNRCVECHRLAARADRAAGKKPGRTRPPSGPAAHADGEDYPAADDVRSLFHVETLQAALAAGRTRYFTGVACPAGHVDQRTVANQQCISCARRRSAGTNRSRALELWNMLRAQRPHEAVLPEWPRISQAQAAKRGLSQFYEGTMCKAGHIGRRYTGNGECVTCSRTKNQERYANDPLFRQRRIDYEVKRNQRPAVRARRLIQAKEYNARPVVRARLYNRLKTDPLFRASWNIRSLLRMALKKHRHRKASRLRDILGCSIAEFRRHIAKQFVDGLGWANYGQWELDHIVPLSSARTGADVITLFHHTNMRPMYRAANRSKGAKRIFLI